MSASTRAGCLTDAIDQHPHRVLLLDEIEKAHPDLFNILLQVMDYGKLTDHNGKNVDFRNVILIMTTNAGASDLAKPAIGFGSGIREGDDEEAINRMFTPEFRNRLDAIISFAPLSPETIGRVVDKFVLQLEEQLADRNVTIELDASARAWLAEKGYDPLFGARPLARIIQEHIKKPLAEELLFGRLAKGGHRPRAPRQGRGQARLRLSRRRPTGAAADARTAGARAGRVEGARSRGGPNRRAGCCPWERRLTMRRGLFAAGALAMLVSVAALGGRAEFARNLLYLTCTAAVATTATMVTIRAAARLGKRRPGFGDRPGFVEMGLLLGLFVVSPLALSGAFEILQVVMEYL